MQEWRGEKKMIPCLAVWAFPISWTCCGVDLAKMRPIPVPATVAHRDRHVTGIGESRVPTTITSTTSTYHILELQKLSKYPSIEP